MTSSREIDSVRSQANIVAIVGRHVQLRKEGHEFIGCCPFHEEKTPSFKVDPKKNGGVYICFGCGAKGDVFRFIQMIDGLDFKAAITRVKELSGMTTSAAGPEPRRRPAVTALLPAPSVRANSAVTTITPGTTGRVIRAAQSTNEPAPAKLGPITAVYTYLDEKGNALFEACRHEPGEPIIEDGVFTGKYKPKAFRQRVPVPGGFSYSVKGVRRVLYRLPQLLAASEVWICEGEKDVHTLESLSFTATTNAGGAKSPWLAEYSESLKGKDVIIVPDNDEPGRARGEAIARELAAHAERVTTITLPDACKDVTDYIEAGNSAHDLRVLVEETRVNAKPAPDPSYAPLEQGEELQPNDIGRLIIRDHIIIADQMGYIFEYNHRFWERTTRARIAAYAMAYDTHRHTKSRRRSEAADYVIVYSHTKQIKWRAVLPNEVPVWNGVVNLDTGNLRPHRKEDYLETVPPVAYTGKKACPVWLDALKFYWGEDADYEAKVDALQEFFGYCLMTHARYKRALALLGESDTGKSQIPNVIRLLVGNDNTCAVSVEDMDDARKRSPLVGKMMNILTELTSKSVVADGGFKTLISTEEPLQIDPKYDQPIMYAPIAKHVICCNSLPRVTDLSRGTFNRLLLLKFNRVLPPEKQDRNIMDKFRLETEGILAWALEGALRLFKNGGAFTRVAESESAIDEYREEQNPVNAFLAECCSEVEEHLANPILLSVFTEKFSNWIGKNLDIRTVSGMLRSSGVRVDKVKTRGLFLDKRCVFGLEFVEQR